MRTSSQLMMRRRQMIDELSFIYPVLHNVLLAVPGASAVPPISTCQLKEKACNNAFQIANVHLPDAENFAGKSLNQCKKVQFCIFSAKKVQIYIFSAKKLQIYFFRPRRYLSGGRSWLCDACDINFVAGLRYSAPVLRHLLWISVGDRGSHRIETWRPRASVRFPIRFLFLV